jgi:hypothetical protein
MVCCDVCDRWVHVACDRTGAEEALANEDAPYTCLLCDPVKLAKYDKAVGGRVGSLRVGVVDGKKVASPIIKGLVFE